jgi:hypothetical protein
MDGRTVSAVCDTPSAGANLLVASTFPEKRPPLQASARPSSICGRKSIDYKTARVRSSHHPTRGELRICHAQKVGGLRLTRDVLCIDFGKVAQNAKRQEGARMKSDFKIRWFEKIGAVNKPKTQQ